MFHENFKWSNHAAMVIKAKINNHNVQAVVDTGCSGSIVSQGCYERLDLKEDENFNDTVISGEHSLQEKKYIKRIEFRC